MSFTRKIAIRKGGRFVAIGTRNICSSKMSNFSPTREQKGKKKFLKGPLAHGIGAREVVYLKKTQGADQTPWPESSVRLWGSRRPTFALENAGEQRQDFFFSCPG